MSFHEKRRKLSVVLLKPTEKCEQIWPEIVEADQISTRPLVMRSTLALVKVRSGIQNKH